MKIVYTIDRWVDRLLTPKYNPFYWLGTICFFFLILIVISGIYLFIFYRTSNPYETVQYLTANQWYAGGIMRSIHRYASDGLIIFLILHLLREFFLGRYRQWRWVSWVSGNALLIASIILGIIGYFLVWDQRAQLVALKTAHLLDDIPIFVEPPPRSFLTTDTMSRMLFFVLLLAHIGITLVGMSILVGIHASRNARAALKSPRAIAIVILIALSLLSLVAPATSAPPADIGKLPVDVPLDWFYLFIYPLASALPKGAFWFTAVSGTLLLFIAPWLTRAKRLPAAQVMSERCVGCEQCNKDCPYEAIRMVPRKDGRPYLLQAVVIPNSCASCGICVGSCDSNATYLPDRPMEEIEEEISKLLYLTKRQDGEPKILGLICERTVRLEEVIDTENRSLKGMPNVPVVTFPCAGMIHHSIIDHAFESGAEGVFVYGCQTEECYYREGTKWARARLRGERAPVLVLKGAINYSRVRAYWSSPRWTNKDFINEINLFQEELKHISNTRTYSLIESTIPGERTYKKAISFFAVPLTLAPIFLILFLSTKPTYPFYSKDQSLIKFTFKYSGKQEECEELTEEKTETKLKHMRKTNSPFAKIRTECKRKRLPSHAEVYLDNKNVLSRTYYPTGLRRDGSTFAYEEIPVASGIHEIKVRMRDVEKEEVSKKIGEYEVEEKTRNSGEDTPSEYTFEETIRLETGQINIIDFDRENNKFYILGQRGEP